MKAFSFPLLCSHQSKLRTHPLDYHRSSFLFCFSPRVPIHSIFISPSVPFTAAFISTRSLNLPQAQFYTSSPSFHQLSDKHCFTSSTCLSAFSPLSFNLPFSDGSLPRLFPLSLAYFVCCSAFLSMCQMHSLSLLLPPFSLRTN